MAGCEEYSKNDNGKYHKIDYTHVWYLSEDPDKQTDQTDKQCGDPGCRTLP